MRLRKLVELGRPLLLLDEVENIFLNLHDLLLLHRSFLRDLEKLRQAGTRELQQSLAGVVKQFVPFFKIYSQYIQGYGAAQSLLQRKRASNRSFREFIELQEACEGCDLDSLLITPIQRIPRYLLLLEAMYKHSTKQRFLNRIVQEQIQSALEDVKQLADSMNARYDKNEARVRVLQIQEMLFNNKINLVDSRRYYVRHGALKKRWNNTSFKYKNHRKYLFVLLNDVLLYAARPSATHEHCSVKKVLALRETHIVDLPDTAEVQNSWAIHNHSKSIEVYAASSHEKALWLADLARSFPWPRAVQWVAIPFSLVNSSRSRLPVAHHVLW